MEAKIPKSYEELSPSLTHTKVSHYPAGAPEATQIIIVSLNRPKQNNAWTMDMSADFEKIFPLFDADNRVRCIVLTAEGKYFCAGADLQIGFPSDPNERAIDHRDGGGRLSLAIWRCRKPTIAAMAGTAVGVGMTMVLACAIRIAHTNSRYGFVFARRGVTMEANSSYLLPRLIGYSRAMYLVTTGGVFPPNSPHFGHLFQETFENAGDVLPRALELANEIATRVSPAAQYLNRELMWRNPGTLEGTHLLDSAVIGHMYKGPDCAEGIQSFFEKREPKFLKSIEASMPDFYPWWRSEAITDRRYAIPIKPKI